MAYAMMDMMAAAAHELADAGVLHKTATPSARIEILPEAANACTVADDPIDVFSQDEPEARQTILIRYHFATGTSFVRAFDVENLNQWFERERSKGILRDPIITSVMYTQQERTIIAARAAKVFCLRNRLNPTTDGALFVGLRLLSDDALTTQLKAVKWASSTFASVWAVLEEAVQRRRSVALAFLYDVGVSLFHFNLNTLATLVLLAMERGWPTRELLRLMYKRIPSRQVHRKLGLPWSPAILLVLSVAMQTLRHKDVSRIMRRLVFYADPVAFRNLRLAMRNVIVSDSALSAIFNHYDLRTAGVVIAH